MVVVEERGNLAGLSQAPRERSTWERGRAAPELGVRLPSHPSTIYRWGEEGAGPPRSHLGLGAAAKGGEGETCAPSKVEAPPPQTLFTLGPGVGAHQPTWVWSPPTLGPCSPLGPVAPPGGPPGILPVVPVRYR